MGLEIAQQIALSGLTATQAQIQVTAGNIANVQTPGYSEEILPQVALVEPLGGAGVSTGAVQRQTDQTLQNDLLAQTTTASNASTLNSYYQQIQNLFGQVGTGATLNDALDNFASAMQTVATTPSDPVAQGAAVAAGQSLAQSLNQTSAGIQTIRQSADSDLSTAITTLNTALDTIASLNGQISNLQAAGQTTATLQDQRDQALNQVSQLVGVNDFVGSNGEMVVFTTTGQTLVDISGAQQLSYSPTGNVAASATLSPITLNGVDISSDMNTGQIGALLTLRDTDLPNLTAELNQFTNNLFAGTAITQSTLTMNGNGAPLAAGDTYTATIDGSTYTTLGLPSGPTMNDVATALNALLGGATIAVGGGAPQSGDSFTATINGTPYTTSALPGGGPFGTSDIVNSLNATLSAITVPVTLGGPGPATGDTFVTTLNGTAYTSNALAGGGPYTLSDIVTAINATLPPNFTATASGGNIVIQDSSGVLTSATIANSAGNTGSETFAGTAISVPVTLNTPATGDKFDTTVNGTTYTSSALTGGGPYTLANIVTAINATLPSNLTASINGGQIQISDSSGTMSSVSLADHPGNFGNTAFGVAGQTSSYFAETSGSNIVIGNATGAPVQASMALVGGSPGTETFAAPTYTTLSASTNAGNIVLTDTSGNPITAAITTNPIFTAGAPNDIGSPTTINFTQTSGSLNPGQTFDVTVDGTTYGPTTALVNGATTVNDVVTAIQNLFTAQGVAYTANVVGGQIQIADPAANPITASITVASGPGSEAFTSGVATGPLNTTKSGLGVTDDANHFFSDFNIASGLDNASTIQVNPSLLSNTALLNTGALGSDPSISQNLAAALANNYNFSAAGGFTNAITTTLGNYSAQMIGQVAANASTVSSNSTYQTALQSQLTTQLSTVSGVSLDEELSNLIAYQNAYGASAHVMTTIERLYDTLMQF